MLKKSLFLILLAAQGLTCFAQQESEVELDIGLITSGHWFSSLEEALANPEQVYYLDLSLRKLKTFPKDIFALKNLKRLYVANNYWPAIPDEIATLSQLEVLDISSNYYMKRLPVEALSKMNNLKHIIIKDHALVPGEVDRLRKAMPHCKIESD
ncbi:MAG: hypothetical protein KatS3mg031_0499 [Chitinophagales bacterium]|nr:MAG: hypothetical protein KatS3mg031_0499 [Chitinophagales bacterium]